MSVWKGSQMRHRRYRLSVLAMLALVVGLVTGCTGHHAPSRPAQSFPQVQTPTQAVITFLGRATDGETAVAVVTDRGAGVIKREVRAYVCDGRQVSEWFIGSMVGNQVDLTAQGSPAHLTATLTAQQASGRVELAGGRAVDFIAAPATEVAGLYEGALSPEGILQGTSGNGGILTARLGEEVKAGVRQVTGTISHDGADVPFTAYADQASTGECRIIVAADRTVKGSNTDKKKTFYRSQPG
jgi:hypothetical protein